MAENSGIEWTDHTFNPWIGCQKVSEACRFCYAESSVNRYGGDFHGKRVVTSDANWKKPLKWNRDYEWQRQEIWENHGPTLRHPRVFCASWADVFEDWRGPIVNNKGQQLWECSNCDFTSPYDCMRTLADQGLQDACQCSGNPDFVPLGMTSIRKRLFNLIDATPHLDWLLLTKRPENIQRMWPAYFPGGYIAEAGSMNQEGARPNVWLGCTVENQEQADKRIPELLKCRELSPVLFLSMEPLLGPVDLTRIVLKPSNALELGKPDVSIDCLEGWYGTLSDDRAKIDWVISGSESGPNARPSHINWFRALREQCSASGTAYLHKQNGEWVEADQVSGGVSMTAKMAAVMPDGRVLNGNEAIPSNQGVSIVHRVGKKAAGRLLDGIIHNEFPKVNQ